MKITNNHKGPLGLPDGTILLPGQATPIANWDALKGNAVLQGWLKGKILTAEGGKATGAAQGVLLGSNVLPASIQLADGVSLQLGEVVRRAHEASGLSVADWNALDEYAREGALATTVSELQSAAEAEAKKAPANEEAGAGKASASAATQSPPSNERDVLLARAKELGIEAKGTWGVQKLQAAIAATEAKKGEG